MEKQEYIEAGRISNTHGVAGEVKIEVWLDSPQFMKKCGRIFAEGKEYKIVSAKIHKGSLIAKLEGIEDVNAAMSLKGKTAYILRSDAKLPEGGYFIQDIIGAIVRDEQGREIGRLREVLERPASNIYVVQGEEEHLIPAVPEFIMSTDPEAGVISVRLMEGM